MDQLVILACFIVFDWQATKLYDSCSGRHVCGIEAWVAVVCAETLFHISKSIYLQMWLPNAFDKDCFHTRAKCVIWIIIWIAHFELRSVHTRCNWPNLGFCIPAGEECLGTLPIKHAQSSYFLQCFCTCIQRAVYRRKWLEGYLAPAPKLRFRGQGIHTVISSRDLRDA